MIRAIKFLTFIWYSMKTDLYTQYRFHMMNCKIYCDK